MKIKIVIAATVIAAPMFVAAPAVAIGNPPGGEIGDAVSLPPSPVPLPVPGDLDGDNCPDSQTCEVGEGVSIPRTECDNLGCGGETRPRPHKKAPKVLPHTGAAETAGLAAAGLGLIALGGIAYSISKRQDR